ncbi:MAG: N-acetylmuramoyl-L-alanine amidase, partial [candidate division Zixibacteria bacterium]|nr:N-acetylmuramoyl-L-alanine amidase [candidate division Zixibacteria bacterium]
MILRSVFTHFFVVFLFPTLFVFFPAPPATAAPKIVDYQKHLPKKFKKRARDSTRFIVVHSTESGLQSALTSLARGGHSNYLIAVNGTLYRIVDKTHQADHAGLSMWDGLTDISSHSIGIEIVGYHNEPFTDKQYESLKWLLETLQKQYDIPDWRVLEHFRVAYGEPNRYVKKRHRGRKKDPGIFNFDRARAGLTDDDGRNNALYDPDVAEGRLIADPDIDVARLKTK